MLRMSMRVAAARRQKARTRARAAPTARSSARARRARCSQCPAAASTRPAPASASCPTRSSWPAATRPASSTSSAPRARARRLSWPRTTMRSKAQGSDSTCPERHLVIQPQSSWASGPSKLLVPFHARCRPESWLAASHLKAGSWHQQRSPALCTRCSLTDPPDANETVLASAGLTSIGGNGIDAGSVIKLSPLTLYFSALNFSTPQQLTVTRSARRM